MESAVINTLRLPGIDIFFRISRLHQSFKVGRDILKTWQASLGVKIFFCISMSF